MKKYIALLCICIPLGLFAQNEKKERPFFRRHIIHVAPAFQYGFEPFAILGGASYSYRFTPVVALTTTAQGGKNAYGPLTRFFVESQFNIKGENRVQPVFLVGGHVGSVMAQVEVNGKERIYGNVMGGLSAGVGIEVLFGKKRWLAGAYVRGLWTLGTKAFMSLDLHFQPTIAYRI